MFRAVVQALAGEASLGPSSASFTSVDTNQRPLDQQAHVEDNLDDASGGPPVKFIYVRYRAPPCTDLKFCDLENDLAERDDEDIYDYDEDLEDEEQEKDEGPHLLSWDTEDNANQDQHIYEDYLDDEDDATTICSVPNDPYLNLRLRRTSSLNSCLLQSREQAASAAPEIPAKKTVQAAPASPRQHQYNGKSQNIFVNRRHNRKSLSCTPSGLNWTESIEQAGLQRSTTLDSAQRNLYQSATANAITEDIRCRDKPRQVKKEVGKPVLKSAKSPKSVFDVFDIERSDVEQYRRQIRSALKGEARTVKVPTVDYVDMKAAPLLPQDFLAPGMITCSYDIDDDDSFDWTSLEVAH